MQFKKYNPIENAYQADFINAIIKQGHAKLEYVVQEKVHGANLSFITDGHVIRSAKRTELISDHDPFYNATAVLERYRTRILNLYAQLAKQFDIRQLAIFGELFGGGYPHPEVPPDKTAKLIQKGIYYSPTNDFFAFDILLDGEQFLDVRTTTELFEKHGFLCAQTLFAGTLRECLDYPTAFKTTLPSSYDLPELDGNICEGVVIRPIAPTFLRTGSRVLIKNKNDRWAENNNFIDKAVLGKSLREDEAFSEEAMVLCEEIHRFITTTRLENLISKIGEVNPDKEFGKVLGLYNQDVLADFFKTHRDKYDELEKRESKAVTKFLNKHASQLITDYLGQ